MKNIFSDLVCAEHLETSSKFLAWNYNFEKQKKIQMHPTQPGRVHNNQCNTAPVCSVRHSPNSISENTPSGAVTAVTQNTSLESPLFLCCM